jgi:hypothetical protein
MLAAAVLTSKTIKKTSPLSWSSSFCVYRIAYCIGPCSLLFIALLRASSAQARKARFKRAKRVKCVKRTKRAGCLQVHKWQKVHEVHKAPLPFVYLLGTQPHVTVLLCHGQPTWSYLYRKIISPLVAAGYRCVAPDLIGFGKSDKHVLKSAYTYETHVKWLSALVLGLEKLCVLRPPSRPSPTSIIASAASQHRYWSNTSLPVVGENGRSAPMPRIQAQEQLPSLVLPWHVATMLPVISTWTHATRCRRRKTLAGFELAQLVIEAAAAAQQQQQRNRL